MKLFPIAAGQTVAVEGLRFTALALDHVVPTLGFVIEDDDACVAIISDTTSTPAIWDTLNQWPRPLDALFLECAFPNRMRWLADKAKHLTPAQFQEVYAQIRHLPPVVAVHIKPAFREEILKELQALCLDVKVLSEDKKEIELKEIEEDIAETARALGINLEGEEALVEDY